MKRIGFWLAVLALLIAAVVAEAWPHLLAENGVTVEPRVVKWAAFAGIGVIALVILRRIWQLVTDRENWI